MRRSMVRLAVALGMATAATFCGAQDIRVEVNGTPLIFANAQPQYINGRVLVPMRRIFEQLGAQVNWDPGSRKVWATKGSSDVELWIGNPHAIVNGSRVTLDVPAMVVGGSTMVPIRFVSESLGAQVGWMEAQQLVTIDTSASEGTSAVVREPQTMRRVLVPASAVIPATLSARIRSYSSKVGDSFSAAVDTANLAGDVSLPPGTVIEGHIAGIRPLRDGHEATLDLVADRLIFPNGRRIRFDAAIVSVDNPRLTRGGDGTFYSNSDFTLPSGTRIEFRARRNVTRASSR